jgi:hypothetical protein
MELVLLFLGVPVAALVLAGIYDRRHRRRYLPSTHNDLSAAERREHRKAARLQALHAQARLRHSPYGVAGLSGGDGGVGDGGVGDGGVGDGG